ncbi:hypothetical protein ACVW0J_007678 [Bradyrhizobium sp. i1.7.7]
MIRFGCDIDVIRNSWIRSCSGLSMRSMKAFAAAADQRGVEVGLGFEAPDEVLLGCGRLQPCQGFPDPSSHFRIVEPGAFAAGESFEHRARRVQLPGFFEADRGDHGAAVRDDVDEAVGFEGTQGFADRGAADAHHLAELTLDQALARFECSGHDRLAQLLRDHRPDGRDVLDAECRLQFATSFHVRTLVGKSQYRFTGRIIISAI